MKVIESYGSDTAAGCRDTNSGLLCLAISDFPSTIMQIFIRPYERAQKMLRIHHLNLFHIRRSLHLIFR